MHICTLPDEFPLVKKCEFACGLFINRSKHDSLLFASTEKAVATDCAQLDFGRFQYKMKRMVLTL